MIDGVYEICMCFEVCTRLIDHSKRLVTTKGCLKITYFFIENILQGMQIKKENCLTMHKNFIQNPETNIGCKCYGMKYLQLMW